MSAPSAVHVVVKGRVQGVGYRYFAQAAAHELGLIGWVKNLPNGQVEAQAEGPQRDLEQWIDELRQGPPLSRVEALDVTWGAPGGPYAGFEIR